MSTLDRRPFRESFGEAMQAMSDVARTFSGLSSETNAKACVKALDDISLLMSEATLSIERATMTLERAAGYAPYKGKES